MDLNISTEVVKWVKYDDKIKEYNDKCKLLKDEKDKISQVILNSIDPELNKNELPKYSIEAMNARLSCQETNNYEGLTNKFLCECFREYFDSEEKSKELLLFIKNKRQVTKKKILKREYLMD
tara:strand:+ start:1252 stop:1617 length:366 start_codon:yes stop_codon:yes gene_type:complete